MPLSDDVTDDIRLDIIDPAWPRANRTISERGLGDFEVATNAVLLSLFDHFRDNLSFVDIGAGTGISSMLCAGLCRPQRVVAVEPRERLASMLERIAAANALRIERTTDLSSALRDTQPGLRQVIRVGSTVDTTDVLNAITAASVSDRPLVVIVGDRDREALVESATEMGYQVCPLTRYPSWRPLRDGLDPAPADGWLLIAEPLTDGLRERHSIWAAALGACTPDRNDSEPFMVELRSALRARRGWRSLMTAARLDMGRGARRGWRTIDPWLPPSESPPGRVIDQVLANARRVLRPPGPQH